MSEQHALPHQEAFLAEFPDAPREVVLIAPPGTGTSWTMAVLTAQVAEGRGRVLHLAPAALVAQLSHQLRVAVSGHHEIGVLDRTTRRTFEPWLRGESENGPQIIVVSVDYAKRADMRSVLEGAPWALVIAHDGSGRGRERIELLERLRISVSVARVVVVSHVALDVPDTSNASVIEWKRDELRARDGSSLFAPRETRVIEYRRRPTEARALERLLELIRTLETGSLGATRLLAAASSSAPALEEALMTMLQQTAVSAPAMEGALAALDAIDGDSKFEALQKALDALGGDRPIVVATSFLRTVFYLQTALSAAGHTTTVLHGGLTADERAEAIRSLSVSRGVVLLTDAMATSLSPLRVSHVVVSYDLPSSLRRLEARWSLVEHPGDPARPTMLRFVDRESGSPLDEAFERLVAKSDSIARGIGRDTTHTLSGGPGLPEEWRLAFEELAKSEDTEPAKRTADGKWVVRFEWGMSDAGRILATLPGKFEHVAHYCEEMIDNTGEAVDTETESSVWASDESRAIFEYTEHWQAGLSGSVSLFADEADYRRERDRLHNAFTQEPPF